MKFELQEYQHWKDKYPAKPHLLPYLQHRQRKFLQKIKEQEKNRPTNLYNQMLGTYNF